MLKSTTDRYGAVPITIHWLSAIVIIVAIATGFQAGNAIDPAIKAGFLRIHIPIAISVLLLTVIRIVWWLFDRKPQPVKGSPVWQERLARAVHIGFYVIILGMIASGIGMIILSGAGPTVLSDGAGQLPNFQDYPPRAPHGLGANLLLAFLAAHVGAALYHHFIRRDGLLWRMWYGHR
ncbi:cytochrome b [Agrobacterium leguminum]|uniref:cytochrome b n=1 Tax=Agrobacterium leguminum TaxID=2792015 RepID=UPI003CE5041C